MYFASSLDNLSRISAISAKCNSSTFALIQDVSCSAILIRRFSRNSLDNSKRTGLFFCKDTQNRKKSFQQVINVSRMGLHLGMY